MVPYFLQFQRFQVRHLLEGNTYKGEALITEPFIIHIIIHRSSAPEMFFGKGVLKIGEHPCQSVIEITPRCGCSPVNMKHFLEHLFLKKPLDSCFCVHMTFSSLVIFYFQITINSFHYGYSLIHSRAYSYFNASRPVHFRKLY